MNNSNRTITIRISKNSRKACELACDLDITAGVWTSADVMHAAVERKSANPYALDFAQIRAASRMAADAS
jgi:hypothetical protein